MRLNRCRFAVCGVALRNKIRSRSYTIERCSRHELRDETRATRRTIVIVESTRRWQVTHMDDMTSARPCHRRGMCWYTRQEANKRSNGTTSTTGTTAGSSVSSRNLQFHAIPAAVISRTGNLNNFYNLGRGMYGSPSVQRELSPCRAWVRSTFGAAQFCSKICPKPTALWVNCCCAYYCYCPR